MDWSTAQAIFRKDHYRKLSWEEMVRWDYQAWDQRMSIAGLWSYRGKLWKRCTGSYPTPEEVGLPADHDFFNPDVVCFSQVTYRDGRKKPPEYHHHGRKLKPGHRLYPKDA